MSAPQRSSGEQHTRRPTGWTMLKAVARLPKFGSRSSKASSNSRSTRAGSSSNDISRVFETTDDTLPQIFVQETNGIVRTFEASGGVEVQDSVAVKPEVPQELPNFDSRWKCRNTCPCPLRTIFNKIGLHEDFRNLNALERKLKDIFNENRDDPGSVKFKMQQLRGLEATRFQHLLDQLPQQTTDETILRKCQSWSRKLARASQALPPSLFIEEVLVGTYPIDGGGCSDMYRGVFERKQVAVKATRVFRGSTSDDDRLTIYMNLCVEALTWRHAAHPTRILPLLGVTYHGGRLCLVSPWMQNGNILTYLSTNSAVRPLNLIRQIAEGLQCLHKLKLTHGDLKPQNILIGDNGEVLLNDLGLTQAINTSIPLSGRGTRRYMAPEVHTAAQIPSNREDAMAVDIFAFAMTVYEIMVGAIPFRGEDDFRLYNVIVIERRRPPLPVSPKYQVPLALWQIIETCWEHDARFRLKIGPIIDKLAQIPP